jgi:SAM-dependent methyltransferase
MDLATLSDRLVRDATGIWTSRGAETARLSFPADAHALNFKVEDDSFWFQHRNEVLASALARFPLAGPFLDIGAGNGVVSKRLEAAGIETVVLEPGPNGASYARQRGLANVVCATLEDAAFHPGSFGGAGLFDVIEHVEDPAPLLAAARRVLRPRGVLAVTVPSYEWLWSDADDQAGHFRRYTRRRLRAELDRAGFDVEWASYFFTALTVPIFIGRSLRYRFAKPDRDTVVRAAENEHSPGRIARLAIDALLGPELGVVQRGGALPFGSSILAIASARAQRGA